MELTRITEQPIHAHPVVLLPIIYDIGNQVTQLVERRDLSTPGFIMQAANIQLHKFLDKRGASTTESSLYAAIHDLLSNLSLQMPGGPGPMPGGPGFMQGQMSGPPNQQMPIQNPQAMGQVMGVQQMNQGYGQMGQMGGPPNE